VSIAIVLIWASLLAAHLLSSYSQPDALPVLDLKAKAEPEAELTQRGVFYRGARIGYIRERLIPIEGGKRGFRAEQKGELRLTLLGRERQVEMEGTAETGAGGELRGFSFRLTTASRRAPFQTTVLGKVEGTELVLTVRSASSERTERRPIDEPIVLPLNMYYSLASRGFIPGESYRLRLFDPMTLSDGEAVIAVKGPEIVRWGGREEEANRLQTTFAGLTTTAWVNGRGEVLQEETPLGWTLLKEAPESSLRAQGTATAPDVLVMTAVPALGFASESSELAAATVELIRFPDGFDALDGGRQRREGTRVEITRESPPYVGRAQLAEEERKRFLAPDGFIQSDDPEIVRFAERISGDTEGVDRVRAISTWVYENIAKSPTLSIPSATEILEQRVGDCNEHAVLFTALSRAAGIPTRIATGLTYASGQFYYHAWAEVYLGGWLALDPTLGQFPADPLHLRLLTGGIESQYEVLNLLGKGAAIEVVSTR
jgi:hypothetical protein